MTSIVPIQKILFGSPGTGKSHQIKTIATEQLGVEFSSASNTLQNTVQTVFHPEYTHSDFLGKLLPQTQGTHIIYKFYPGHFLQVLGMAYRSIINLDNQHYVLVIDELNRGNASAIFGPVFQLLDRDDDHWSSYAIDISDLELMALLNVMSYKTNLVGGDIHIQDDTSSSMAFNNFFRRREQEFNDRMDNNAPVAVRLSALLSRGKISIPPNLSILATINTSDESIYYLDSAFKRRWDWEYVESPHAKSLAPKLFQWVTLSFDDGQSSIYWTHCIVGINKLILDNARNIRRIEDKQIGWWFIKPRDGRISLQQVKDKLMFYLWDSVFVKDRRPLQQLLAERLNDSDLELITFADFVCHTETLMKFFEGSHQEATSWSVEFDSIPF
jgi:5-methylcytosine-specific restriction enzyme B